MFVFLNVIIRANKMMKKKMMTVLVLLSKTCLWTSAADDVGLDVAGQRMSVVEILLFQSSVVDETPLVRAVRVARVRPAEILCTATRN